MKHALAIGLIGLLAFTGCRKRTKTDAPVTVDGETANPSVETSALKASEALDPAAAAAPLPPPNAEITVAVERRFLPAEPMNAYSPAQPGDYQAQLNLYNRVLRKRAADLGNTPDTLQELMASSGLPKPPQPPAGRKLTYDRKTITVSLQ